MNTEKEIELNKERIKDLEIEINDQENKVQSLAIELEKTRYEYNLSVSESTTLTSKLGASKKDYIFQVKDFINNPATSKTRMLRKNIVNISAYDVQEGDTGEFAELSKWIIKMRKKYNKHPRFELDNLPSDKIIEISSKTNVRIDQIANFTDLESFCLYSPHLIIKNEERTKLTPAVAIEIPNSGKLILIEYANLDSYELMKKAKDEKNAKKYLEQFTKELRNQIDEIYKINYKNNKYIDDDSIGHLILYFECEDALKNALDHDPEILEYALEKDIEISFPMLFYGIANFMSYNLEKKGSKEAFKRYEHIREQLIEKKTKEINEKQSKISQLLKINFEYLKSPSYQVKVTLNHEENYVLEEIVNAKGSNKSSVLRQILMEYNGIYKERDALKISVEKLNLEKNFIEDKCMRDLREIEIKHELMQKDLETELKRQLLEVRHQRDELVKEHRSDIEILKNELIRKTENYQSESTFLKDEFERREELMYKAIKSIEESISNNKQTLKEDVIKNAVQVINPKNINEFGKIMELINQNILILCDTSSIASKDQQRFIDMVYGGVYGLKGKIKEVSNKIFLYIPKNFDLFDDSVSS